MWQPQDWETKGEHNWTFDRVNIEWKGEKKRFDNLAVCGNVWATQKKRGRNLKGRQWRWMQSLIAMWKKLRLSVATIVILMRWKYCNRINDGSWFVTFCGHFWYMIFFLSLLKFFTNIYDKVCRLKLLPFEKASFLTWFSAEVYLSFRAYEYILHNFYNELFTCSVQCWMFNPLCSVAFNFWSYSNHILKIIKFAEEAKVWENSDETLKLMTFSSLSSRTHRSYQWQ